MTMNRRRSLHTLALAATSLAVWPGAAAWAQPSATPLTPGGKAVRILVGFPPGGGSDAIARILSDKLKDLLGVPVVVENRPGAGGQIAAQELKRSAADGTTLFLSHDHTISILPLVMKNPGFVPERDFTPVVGVASFVNGLAVSAGTPAKTLAQYVDWIKQHGGGKGVVGIPAPASTPEFLVQLLARRYQIDLVSAPYRGSAPMLADMMGNQIAAGVGSVPDMIEYQRSGKVRMLAVLGGQRQAVLPDVPTLTELGLPGLEEMPYFGIFAPRGTPAAFIERFSSATAQVLAQPAVAQQLTAMGLSVGHMSAQQLASRERAYTQVWRKLIQESGFQPQ